MIRSIARPLVVFCSLFLLLAGATLACAAPVAVEEVAIGGSGYSVATDLGGQNPSVTGFQNAWAVNSSIYYATGSGLGYTTGSQVLDSSAGAFQLYNTSNSERQAARQLDYNVAATGNNILYFSGLVSAPAPGTISGGGFAMMQVLDLVSDLPPGTFGLQWGVNQGEVRLRARSTANVANTDYTIASTYEPGETMLFVLKAEINASSSVDRISVWLNPSDLSSESAAGAPTLIQNTHSLDQFGGLSGRAVDTFGLRTVNFDGNKTVAYDGFRFGTTWGDVSPYLDVTELPLVADAHVVGGSPTANFGSDQVMEVKNSTGSFDRKAYTRFDLSGIDPGKIIDARLALTSDFDGGAFDASANQWTFNVFGLADGDAGESWDEFAINWNNAPQNDTGDGAAMLAGATLLGQFTLGGSPDRQLMLTAGDLPGLVAFLAADTDGQATLIFTRETSGDTGGDFSLSTLHGFRSRQFDIANGTNFAPRLFVVQVPETSTFALLGAGVGLLVLVGGLRRRRSHGTSQNALVNGK